MLSIGWIVLSIQWIALSIFTLDWLLIDTCLYLKYTCRGFNIGLHNVFTHLQGFNLTAYRCIFMWNIHTEYLHTAFTHLQGFNITGGWLLVNICLYIKYPYKGLNIRLHNVFTPLQGSIIDVSFYIIQNIYIPRSRTCRVSI